MEVGKNSETETACIRIFFAGYGIENRQCLNISLTAFIYKRSDALFYPSHSKASGGGASASAMELGGDS